MKNVERSLSQQGFALVLVVVVLVALVGVIGYFVWSSNQPRSQYEQAPSSNEESEVDTDQSGDVNEHSLTYLDLNDWSVRFTIPDSLDGTEVKFYKRTEKDQSGTYYSFTTSRIQVLGGKCATPPFGDTVLLRRTKSQEELHGDAGQYIGNKPIDEFYYSLSSPIASCSGFDAEGNMRAPSQIETKDRDALREMLGTITPAT